MKIIGKIVVTVIALLVAIATASAAFELFFGNRPPALIMVAALAIVSPIIFLIWRRQAEIADNLRAAPPPRSR